MAINGCEGLTMALCSTHASWAVVSRGKGTAEGARVTGLKGWTAALQSWPALLTSSVMLGKLARFPVGDCDKAVHCFLHAWHSLQSQSVLWGQEGVFFIINCFPDPICRTGPKLKVCVCCEIQCRARVGRQGLCWPLQQLKLALQLELLNGWATADLQKGRNTCNYTWTLCFEYKVKQHGRTWKPKSLSLCIKYRNLLTLHFQQAASHLQNT